MAAGESNRQRFATRYASPPMRASRGTAVVAVLAASCGSTTQTTSIIGPTGGEVCLANSNVCVLIPPGALDKPVPIRILPTNDVPEGSFGGGYDIGPSGTTFLKPVKVTFKIESLYDEDSGVDPLLLRLFTKVDNVWEPLATPVPPLDRVRRTLSGTVEHLSPFVILRADRLPDGGMPIEIDGGKKDAGVIVIPYFDAGKRDGG